MGVIINYTDSNGDDFIHNRITGRGCEIATSNGYVRAERTADAQAEPLELEEIKTYLNLDPENADQNGDVEAWRKAARQKLERDTGIALLPQTWNIYIDQFPSYRQPLFLPIWPILEVLSFSYVTRDGAETNLIASPSTYLELFGPRPARLALAEGSTWPTDARRNAPGTLTVRAGFANAAAIPGDLLMAMKKLIGDFATFRESAMAIPGQVVQSTPFGYADLIGPWVLPGVA